MSVPPFIPGVNDLKTAFPSIAREAVGVDTSFIYKNSRSKITWQCDLGHQWKTDVRSRTKINGTGCPYCSNKKVLSGFNDVKTLSPAVAISAHGWDPSSVLNGSAKVKEWVCEKGHVWKTRVVLRTRQGRGCPVCKNKTILKGFNDLKTRFPLIAKQAHGWDPSEAFPNSMKKLEWLCECGKTWKATPNNRVSSLSGCPFCSTHGYSRSAPSWMYLMSKCGQQQIGITGNPIKRMKTHRSNGWDLIELRGPGDGVAIFEVERRVKKYLREEVGLVKGSYEAWPTDKMKVSSLNELFDLLKLRNKEKLHVLSLDLIDYTDNLNLKVESQNSDKYIKLPWEWNLSTHTCYNSFLSIEELLEYHSQ
jgi:hypothetical protein